MFDIAAYYRSQLEFSEALRDKMWEVLKEGRQVTKLEGTDIIELLCRQMGQANLQMQQDEATIKQLREDVNNLRQAYQQAEQVAFIPAAQVKSLDAEIRRRNVAEENLAVVEKNMAAKDALLQSRIEEIAKLSRDMAAMHRERQEFDRELHYLAQAISEKALRIAPKPT